MRTTGFGNVVVLTDFDESSLCGGRRQPDWNGPKRE